MCFQVRLVYIVGTYMYLSVRIFFFDCACHTCALRMDAACMGTFWLADSKLLYCNCETMHTRSVRTTMYVHIHIAHFIKLNVLALTDCIAKELLLKPSYISSSFSFCKKHTLFSPATLLRKSQARQARYLTDLWILKNHQTMDNVQLKSERP